MHDNNFNQYKVCYLCARYKNKTLKKRYTITSALPYANGPLHIGHIAGAYLPADIFVRYLRSNDRDVVFVCGSDEHGAAITLRAKKEDTTPKAIVDKYHKINKKAFEDFGIDFDIYHRTSDPLHHKTAQDFFLKLNENNAFIKKTTKQFYDEENKQFLADRYIQGTCPKCGYEAAYGDQCEKCGSALSPTELINPKSTISGNAPVLKETSHWYLPMQNHQEWLKTWINEGVFNDVKVHDPKRWKNQVKGQCNSWLDGGLRERAMTRDLDWGVKVPLKDGDGKVLYVWLDAPIGYISATKAWAAENGKDWKDYWQSDETALVHFIGKDNIVFHAIIFPILLQQHGDYILPENVPANAFLNLEGDKLSTSRNWAVWLHEYLEDFPGKQDVLRYVLTSLAPESRDSEFTWKEYQTRNNNELVAIFGNFVNRALVLTQKYYSGVVPKRGETNEMDKSVLAEIGTFPTKIGDLIELYRFKEAQSEMMNLARLGNKYLADTEPWKLIKTDPERVKTIMNIALEITAKLAVVAYPFLPDTSKKLFELLNINPVAWKNYSDLLLKPGHNINKPELLFSKVEDETVNLQVQKLMDKKALNESYHPVKETISFDDFTKLDIRIGEITEAIKIPKTKKLLKLKIDVGMASKTVVSGIAEYYKPEDLIGIKVTILLNLEPRKIKGILSEGMILMAENNDGVLAMLSPDKEINNGAGVR
jgi:methionyl-tRNA synthetase